MMMQWLRYNAQRWLRKRWNDMHLACEKLNFIPLFCKQFFISVHLFVFASVLSSFSHHLCFHFMLRFARRTESICISDETDKWFNAREMVYVHCAHITRSCSIFFFFFFPLVQFFASILFFSISMLWLGLTTLWELRTTSLS